MTQNEAITATRLAAQFRGKGVAVDLALHPEKPKKFFKRANATLATQAIYIGPDDIEKGEVRIKTLATREEESLPLS
jgi:histidyl-tRNA synthetase